MPLKIQLSSCQPHSKLQAREAWASSLNKIQFHLAVPFPTPHKGFPPARHPCSGFMASPCRQLVTMASSSESLQRSLSCPSLLHGHFLLGWREERPETIPEAEAGS